MRKNFLKMTVFTILSMHALQEASALQRRAVRKNAARGKPMVATRPTGRNTVLQKAGVAVRAAGRNVAVQKAGVAVRPARRNVVVQKAAVPVRAVRKNSPALQRPKVTVYHTPMVNPVQPGKVSILGGAPQKNISPSVKKSPPQEKKPVQTSIALKHPSAKPGSAIQKAALRKTPQKTQDLRYNFAKNLCKMTGIIGVAGLIKSYFFSQDTKDIFGVTTHSVQGIRQENISSIEEKEEKEGTSDLFEEGLDVCYAQENSHDSFQQAPLPSQQEEKKQKNTPQNSSSHNKPGVLREKITYGALSHMMSLFMVNGAFSLQSYLETGRSIRQYLQTGKIMWKDTGASLALGVALNFFPLGTHVFEGILGMCIGAYHWSTFHALFSRDSLTKKCFHEALAALAYGLPGFLFGYKGLLGTLGLSLYNKWTHEDPLQEGLKKVKCAQQELKNSMQYLRKGTHPLTKISQFLQKTQSIVKEWLPTSAHVPAGHEVRKNGREVVKKINYVQDQLKNVGGPSFKEVKQDAVYNLNDAHKGLEKMKKTLQARLQEQYTGVPVHPGASLQDPVVQKAEVRKSDTQDLQRSDSFVKEAPPPLAIITSPQTLGMSMIKVDALQETLKSIITDIDNKNTSLDKSMARLQEAEDTAKEMMTVTLQKQSIGHVAEDVLKIVRDVQEKRQNLSQRPSQDIQENMLSDLRHSLERIDELKARYDQLGGRFAESIFPSRLDDSFAQTSQELRESYMARANALQNAIKESVIELEKKDLLSRDSVISLQKLEGAVESMVCPAAEKNLYKKYREISEYVLKASQCIKQKAQQESNISSWSYSPEIVDGVNVLKQSYQKIEELKGGPIQFGPVPAKNPIKESKADILARKLSEIPSMRMMKKAADLKQKRVESPPQNRGPKLYMKMKGGDRSERELSPAERADMEKNLADYSIIFHDSNKVVVEEKDAVEEKDDAQHISRLEKKEAPGQKPIDASGFLDDSHMQKSILISEEEEASFGKRQAPSVEEKILRDSQRG